uniref:Uncharacterized protein n=1 Tax=Anguilla anguilla TaxID=7936 RepID=A0A0E9UV36_ANGAN
MLHIGTLKLLCERSLNSDTGPMWGVVEAKNLNQGKNLDLIWFLSVQQANTLTETD